MKKILAILLAALMAGSLVACGGASNETTSEEVSCETTEVTTEESTTEATTEISTEATAETSAEASTEESSAEVTTEATTEATTEELTIVDVATTGETSAAKTTAATTETTKAITTAANAVTTNKDVSYNVSGKTLTVKLSEDLAEELEDDGWLGICTQDTYVLEGDAEYEKVSFAYKEADGRSFVFNLNDVKPGNYTMVLSSTDEGGFVETQWDATITENKKVSFNFNGKEIDFDDDEFELSDDVEYGITGKYAIFTVEGKTEKKLQLDCWLGVCPVGNYSSEKKADDADVYYVNQDYYFSMEDGKTVFVFDHSQIEKGNYTLVLCSTDESGDVLGQWSLSKTADGKITVKAK